MGRAKNIDHYAIKKNLFELCSKTHNRKQNTYQNCFCFLNKADCPTNSLKKNPD